MTEVEMLNRPSAVAITLALAMSGLGIGAALAAEPAAHDYYWYAMDGDGAMAIDRSTIRRAGGIATVTGWVLSSKPRVVDAQPFEWAETRDEYDCGRHRRRIRLEAVVSVSRNQRHALTKPEFSAWDTSDGSLGLAETMVCRGTLPDDVHWFKTLALFQAHYFDLIRQGLLR